MAPIRYSLHYEDYSEHLMSRFGKLLQMQSLVDMTLMCSSHTLRVHKAVLAASSAYFQEVLQKQSGEPLIILKMRFSVLKSLVEFMYCGKTQCLEENLDELVSAAQFLKIKGLSKVTKEGLGIANNTELPVFTPPVVINRPPQSFIDLHTQDGIEPKLPTPQHAVATSTSQQQQPVDTIGRPNKDMVVRIPFDMEKSGNPQPAVEYSETLRTIKPRRGRPSRSSGWDAGNLGRAAERALLRREQDSRKAIHHLKHLQTRQMQDYMDRVTLSQAVNSICGPESSTNQNYMNIDADFMYMDQTVSSNVLDPSIPYSKTHDLANDNITSSYPTQHPNVQNDNATKDMGTAMSQYVNALKSAGLPTDLPILFESGDGSYINVNEQVLLDMVQSSEIQYEVIEQPNIIENVADPSEIKSIDDLSKSIERGEMLIGGKGYNSNSNYEKDTLNSFNSILADNLESFGEQHNFVVLDPRLQEGHNPMDQDNPNDFSCIDGDMQFFTKSMSEDVKKYYENQHLDDPRVIDQLCPTSTALDNSFNISLLDAKSTHLDGNDLGQQYSSLNQDDLRRNDDCYDFELQLGQGSKFNEDDLNCLMATPKRSDDDKKLYNRSIDDGAKERAEIIKDLMNIENKMNIPPEHREDLPVIETDKHNNDSRDIEDFNINPLNEDVNFDNACSSKRLGTERKSNDISDSISSGIQWDSIDKISNKENIPINHNQIASEKGDANHVSSANEAENYFPEAMSTQNDKWGGFDESVNVENPSSNNIDNNSTLDSDIPFAVGLLPMKQVQTPEEDCLLKRKTSEDIDTLDSVDAKCLKRKVKYKKI